MEGKDDSNMLAKKIEKRLCISKELIGLIMLSVMTVVAIIFLGILHKNTLPYVCIFYLVSLFVYFGYKEKKFKDFDAWEEVEVKVLSAKVVQCICFSTFRQRQDSNESYKPEVKYECTLDEKNIISTQYAVSYDDVDCNFNFDKQKALEYVEKIKREKIIKAFYHKKTKRCVLTLEKAPGYGIPYLGFIIVFGLMCYLSYKIYFWV